MRSRWFAPVCILVMVIFSVAIYHRLPKQLPAHWSASGAVIMGDRLSGVVSLPVVTTLVWLLLSVLPRFDPRRNSYDSFIGTYRLMTNATILFLAGLYIATLGAALGWSISVPQIALVGSGLLLVVVGNEMGRVHMSSFVGVRTRWTMSDPEVWRRTNRVGARLMFVTGLLIVLVGLFSPVDIALPIMLAMIVSTTLFLLWYSYHLSRQHIKVKS
ncbi:MAG: hypothetical protein GFH27_549303n165 [Chloroflexi bacterium AL-W]|nr:hypothetical protein [Chloroflexi bacterium AL-N1]NOK68050.1 hypothetical protein [Chloroflexi bacterium AL-N10]NOK73390.1 hypothetical protein [Chloroflexi bacterium AL-N5]NOK83304.1 hypothetical protein [Chloroflexi bacterium AL-W]NOK87721.1 hypothetical protein [Chloroflexi bacterium AL-N15]